MSHAVPLFSCFCSRGGVFFLFLFLVPVGTRPSNSADAHVRWRWCQCPVGTRTFRPARGAGFARQL